MLMQDAEIIVRRDGAVMRIVIDRPTKKNALNKAMYEQLIAAMAQADADDETRAILLSGAGGAFTAGNDLEDFRKPFDNMKEFPALRFVRALAALQTPIVAAVTGDAVGVGVTMLLHCDLIYASRRARFLLPFVDLGLLPEAGSTLLLPQRVGLAKATELMLLCDVFDAEEAFRLGLVNALGDDQEEVERQALSAARRLADKPRAALAATRRLLRGDAAAVAHRLEEEGALFAAALTTREFRSRLEVFFAPPPPPADGG
jgi:enoyl-CoA hydratase/carnithine racemase